MKTDKQSKNIIISLIVLITLALATFMCLGCSAQPAQANVPEKELGPQVTYEELIHAYNMVLHRVWLDRPNYVEDVLNESDEYIRLYELLYEEDIEEIFSFHNEEDSLTYHINWEDEDPHCCTHVVRHIVPAIPEHSKNKLISVFGNGD